MCQDNITHLHYSMTENITPTCISTVCVYVYVYIWVNSKDRRCVYVENTSFRIFHHLRNRRCYIIYLRVPYPATESYLELKEGEFCRTRHMIYMVSTYPVEGYNI